MLLLALLLRVSLLSSSIELLHLMISRISWIKFKICLLTIILPTTTTLIHSQKPFTPCLREFQGLHHHRWRLHVVSRNLSRINFIGCIMLLLSSRRRIFLRCWSNIRLHHCNKWSLFRRIKRILRLVNHIVRSRICQFVLLLLIQILWLILNRTLDAWMERRKLLQWFGCFFRIVEHILSRLLAWS